MKQSKLPALFRWFPPQTEAERAAGCFFTAAGRLQRSDGGAYDSLIVLVKQRGEKDNISIAVIRPIVTRNDVKADPFLIENDTQTDTIQLD